jgi:uncharacterized protein (TIGR03492 family)
VQRENPSAASPPLAPDQLTAVGAAADRQQRLLVISNGHGEDSIAVEIVRRLPATIAASAYPMLGEGRAYAGVCPIVGPRSFPPSEGHRTRFSLLRDIAAGLGIRKALSFARRDAAKYNDVLVVGDMTGVLLCWVARRKVRIYLDVYKSGYDNRYSGPEIALLRRAAELVLTRDEILASQLRAGGVNARYAGNVLMDTLVTGPYDAALRRRGTKAIAVLPGSRLTYVDNFKVQLEALRLVPGIENMDVFMALARGGSTDDLAAVTGMSVEPGTGRDGDLGTLSDGRVRIQVASGSLGSVLAASDVVLGQAGTANLQALGLGKPVVSFLAEGTTPRRAKRNANFAGDSRLFEPRDPAALAAALERLLADDTERQRRGAVGSERMGRPGAIAAIIDELERPSVG